jgi:hypothetical protein
LSVLFRGAEHLGDLAGLPPPKCCDKVRHGQQPGAPASGASATSAPDVVASRLARQARRGIRTSAIQRLDGSSGAPIGDAALALFLRARLLSVAVSFSGLCREISRSPDGLSRRFAACRLPQCVGADFFIARATLLFNTRSGQPPCAHTQDESVQYRPTVALTVLFLSRSIQTGESDAPRVCWCIAARSLLGNIGD